ncbi:MAG: glycerol-3-phosphate acyltransferase [bacterium]
MNIVGLYAVLAGVVLGSIPFGIIFTKMRGGTDLHKKGSGNIGATNAFRSDPLAGVLTLLGDCLKGFVPCYVLHRQGLDQYAYLAAAGIVFGANWSIFLLCKKGGKGIAALMGVGLALQPLLALVSFGVFLFLVRISKYVSVGSIGAMVVVTCWGIFLLGGHHNPQGWLLLVAGPLAIWKHRENIDRLTHGCEKKFSLKKQPAPAGHCHRVAGFIIHATTDDPDKLKEKALELVNGKRKAEWLVRRMPGWLIRSLLPFIPPRVTGNTQSWVTIADGSSIEMIFVSVYMTPKQMMRWQGLAVRKIVKAAFMLERRGASHIGLGAYTSIVGKRWDMGAGDAVLVRFREFGGTAMITTGNALTVFTGIHALKVLAAQQRKDLKDCRVAFVGHRGNIGTVGTRILCTMVPEENLILIGREDSQERLLEADFIIVATSSEVPLDERYVKKGACIVDLSRPRQTEKMEGCTVVEGGVITGAEGTYIAIPHNLDTNEMHACTAETALECVMGSKESHVGPIDPNYAMRIGRAMGTQGLSISRLRGADDGAYQGGENSG